MNKKRKMVQVLKKKKNLDHLPLKIRRRYLRKRKKIEQKINQSQLSNKTSKKYFVDLNKAATENIIDPNSFISYLRKRIKVNGRPGALGTSVSVKRQRNKIWINSKIHMSKRYIKYLSKKYLKKHDLRDFLRVVALNRNKAGYEMRLFSIKDIEE